MVYMAPGSLGFIPKILPLFICADGYMILLSFYKAYKGKIEIIAFETSSLYNLKNLVKILTLYERMQKYLTNY